MSTELAVKVGSRDLLDTFLRGRTGTTLDAYKRDIEAFASFVGMDPSDATNALLASGNGPANLTAHRWRASMLEANRAPATVNRRLAALRSFVKLARTLGLVPWTLDVPSVKNESYRDTRGPGRDVVRKLLKTSVTSVSEIRDRAIVRLLADMALRRGEVVSLDLEHVDLERSAIMVLGKGKTGRIPLEMPEPTRIALAAWLQVRPACEENAVFISLDRRVLGHRLSGRSVNRRIDFAGKTVGATVRPHGLRHTAITEALDKTDGRVRDAQQFSRHADIRTLGKYDDRRVNLSGKIAKQVANWEDDTED